MAITSSPTRRRTWGPVAGYYAGKQKVPLKLTTVMPHFDGAQLPMIFDVSMGTRREDTALRDELEAVLDRHQAEIRALLAQYHVPLVDEDEGGS